MSESIDQVLRQMIATEVERTRAEDPLLQAVRDLTIRVQSLASSLGQTTNIADQGPGTTMDQADANALHERYRPDDVRLLFVTSRTLIPTPDIGFYFANSHLFRCVRAAFVEAVGQSVPNGKDFLDYFRDNHCWLVMLPDELRRGRGRPPRRLMPDAAYLADIIKQTAPHYVIAARRQVARPIAEALEIAGLPKDRLLAVKTPRELWKPQFAAQLKKILYTNQPLATKRRTAARASTGKRAATSSERDNLRGTSAADGAVTAKKKAKVAFRK
jgi:hypothetical protein